MTETVSRGTLALRAFGTDDLPLLARAFADPEIRRWNAGPLDPEGIAAWARGRNDWTTGHASWAVADVDGALLGSVSLFDLDADQATGEIGYWLAPWARGRGVATAAVRLATDYAFDALRLHRVQLFHATDNPASCAVAERAGFRLEGTLRASYRYGDGRYHDEHLHARLAADAPPAAGP